MINKMDKCIWEENEEGLYVPSCNSDDDDWLPWEAIRHFGYCPYCGKKLEKSD